MAADDIIRFAMQEQSNGDHSAVGSTIDYFYVSTERLLLPACCITTRSMRPTTHASPLGDLTPQRLTIARRPSARRSGEPVLQRITKHPIFHGDVRRHLDAIPSAARPTDEWIRTKQAMTAARTTPRAILRRKLTCL